jgi:hypothetical protein
MIVKEGLCVCGTSERGEGGGGEYDWSTLYTCMKIA